MKCPYCNQEHDEDTIYCPRTGKKIENSMKACDNPDCPKFGMYILSQDSEFCPRCGKPIIMKTAEGTQSDCHEKNNESQEYMWGKKYDEIGRFEDGFSVVCLEDKFGLVNTIGREIISLTDDYIQYMGNGYVMMSNFSSNTDGVIDINGRVVLPCKYDDTSIWYDDESETFSVGLMGKYGAANKDGKIVVPILYDSLSDFYQGIAVARRDNMYFLINLHGEIVWTFQNNYSEVKQLYNGLYGVKRGDKWGCVDSEGNICFDYDFDSVDKGGKDCFVIEKNGMFGMINKDGNEIVSCTYRRAHIHPKDCIAMFQRMDGYWDLYHINNHEMIPGHYKEIQRISDDGKFFTYKDGRYCGLANEKGEVIIAPDNYKLLLPPIEGLCYAVFYDEDEACWHKGDEEFREEDYELYGLINLDGEEVIPCIYQGIHEPCHGIVVAKFRGIDCILDTSNNMIFPNGVDMSEWKRANKF